MKEINDNCLLCKNCTNEAEEDGYIKFNYGYIGEVDGEVFWHSDLEYLKKKANSIINRDLIKAAYELKIDLES